MSYAIVGHCPRCGGPIYAAAKLVVEGKPPGNIYSCGCISRGVPYVADKTTATSKAIVIYPVKGRTDN